MKAPFSAYLDSIEPALRSLVEILGEEYEYVSILSTDSVGFQLSLSQHSKAVTNQNRTTERGSVVRVYRAGRYSEFAFNEFDPECVAEKAAEINAELEKQFALLALCGSETYETPILDDEPIELEHARTVLEEVGIKADVCTSAARAAYAIEVSHMKNQPYDIILVDWKMPGENGVELVKKIREAGKSDPTIIMLTAYSWDDVGETAQQAGVDSFMSKPLFASGVIEEFQKVINNKKILNETVDRSKELEGKRVLLAEDMMINAEIIKQILFIKGVEVTHAQDGAAALEIFQNSEEWSFDAILMDVRMPRMNGLETTRAIRALERPDAASIPIIALTANAFDEDVQRSLQAGMNAHLSKPVEADHLYLTLAEHIRAAERQKRA